MRHAQLVTIQEVLQQIRQRSPHKYRLEAAMWVCAWKETMPKVVHQKTQRVFYKQGKLFVQLSSAVLRQELRLHKGKVLTMLQKYAQACTLQDVVFL